MKDEENKECDCEECIKVLHVADDACHCCKVQKAETEDGLCLDCDEDYY